MEAYVRGIDFTKTVFGKNLDGEYKVQKLFIM
jgi:hypothetical protein